MGDFLDDHIGDILKDELTIDEIMRMEMKEEMEKDKHCFRIIAVRVLAACAPRIRRALKEETTYFLCNDYEDKYDETGKWQTIVKTIENRRLFQRALNASKSEKGNLNLNGMSHR